MTKDGLVDASETSAGVFARTLDGFERTSLYGLPFSDFTGDHAKRWAAMNGLFERTLLRYTNPTILDLALGDGHDTLALRQRGYSVVSNEIDPEARDAAERAAKEVATRLSVRALDWRDFDTDDYYRANVEGFDVLFSLGNAYPTYLLDETERTTALQSFWRLLRPGGTLIFDTRNYDYMTDQAAAILVDPETRFRYDWKTTYLGRQVKGFPVRIADDVVHLIEKHYGRRTYAELDLWSARKDAVMHLVDTALGALPIEILYDYQPLDNGDADFIQYVLVKP